MKNCGVKVFRVSSNYFKGIKEIEIGGVDDNGYLLIPTNDYSRPFRKATEKPQSPNEPHYFFSEKEAKLFLAEKIKTKAEYHTNELKRLMRLAETITAK